MLAACQAGGAPLLAAVRAQTCRGKRRGVQLFIFGSVSHLLGPCTERMALSECRQQHAKAAEHKQSHHTAPLPSPHPSAGMAGGSHKPHA